MKVNLYPIIERAVFEGVARGLTKIQANQDDIHDPQKMVELVADAVLSELCTLFEFGNDDIELGIERTAQQISEQKD